MPTDRKTLTAGLATAGLLGLGLYIAVPASAADPAPSASATAQPKKSDDDRPHWRRHGPRGHGWFGYGARGHGVHGEATVRDGDDGFRLVTWQRGEVTAVSSATLTVKSEDGATWTWTTDDDTRIRKDRDKAALKDIANGDKVLVAGERSGDTRTARSIRVRDGD